ncbi:MAG: hypothetical protein AAGF27_01145 [Pseudomonadota bacterium]
MKSVLRIAGAVFLLVLSAEQVIADRPQAIPLDEGFVITAYGTDTSGNKASMVVWHKVMQYDGKTFVCGAIHAPGSLPRKFIELARINASDGTRLRRGLTGFTVFTKNPSTGSSRGPDGNLHGSSLQPIAPDTKTYLGQPAKCLRSRKTWKASFADGRSVFEMPDQVRIRVWQ